MRQESEFRSGVVAILIGWSGTLLSEEEREQSIWISGNRAETRHKNPD